MPHQLETEYGLTATELLDAISGRFRLRVALEGAVAETHLRRKIRMLEAEGAVLRHEEHDRNGYADFTIRVPTLTRPLLIECKNARDEDYRQGGVPMAHKVETQKTRAAMSDPSSRYYGTEQFDILAVCLGKRTGDWGQFLCVKTENLARHKRHPQKLAAMQRVPLPGTRRMAPWYSSLQELVASL